MTARGKAGANDLVTRRRDDDVEQKIGMTARQKLANVFGDDDVVQRKFGGAPFGPFDVEIGQADDSQIGYFRSGAKPSSAHRAAADEGGFQLQLRLPPVPTVDVATITVNVYDVNSALSPCQGARPVSNAGGVDPRRFDSAAARIFRDATS